MTVPVTKLYAIDKKKKVGLEATSKCKDRFSLHFLVSPDNNKASKK